MRHFIYAPVFLLIFFCISSVFPETQVKQVGILTNKTKNLHLEDHLQILKDPSGHLIFDTVKDQNFQPPSYSSLEPGKQTTYWLRFVLKNESSVRNEWYLEYNYFRGHTSLELFDSENPTGVNRQFDNPLLPFKEKLMRYRNPLFFVNIPPGSLKTFFIRAVVKKDFFLNFRLWNPHAFTEQVRADQFFFGIFTGVILIMAFYNLFLFISFRDRSYIFYIAFIISLGFLELNSKGLLTEIMPSLQLFDYEMASILKIITGIFFILFSRSLMHFQKYFPLWNKILLGLSGLLGLTGVINIFFYQWNVVTMVILGAGGLTVLILSLIRTVKKDKTAGLFILSATLIILSGIIAILPSSLISFLDPVNAYLIDTGFLIMILLFSFSLTNNINRIRLAKEQAQREAIEGLKKADQLKDEFLANTSHELRTPLHGMIGITKSLIDGVAGTLPNEANKRLELMIASGKRLFNLVNDILDFAKIKNDELSLQIKAVDIYIVADTVITTLSHITDTQRVKLINRLKPNLPLVQADENRLQQVFYNLINNSIKFTPQGRVSIEGRVDEHYLVVSVVDTGIGISEDDQEKIFDYFSQAESGADRNHGGTGLGLAITKKLVELQGGGITLESTLGNGSSFTLTLPLAKTDHENKIISSGVSAVAIVQEKHSPALPISNSISAKSDFISRRKSNILIVDDDPVNRQILTDYLSLQNYTPLPASSGQEALEIIHSCKNIGIVLLDLMMPRMSGFEVCRQIRKTYTLYEKPVLILTARTQITDLVDSFYSGANDYLTKPFNRSELLSRVQTLLKLKNLTDSNEELQKVSTLKTRLMHIVAHDLRNPITVIMNYLEIIKEKIGPEREEYIFIDKIKSSSDKILLLIGEFLELSRIENGSVTLTMEKTNVRDLIETSIENYIEAAEKKNQRFIFPPETREELFIYVDKKYFQEAMDNLMSNAVKYSPHYKKIHTDYFIPKKERGRIKVRIEVIDEGPGLTNHDMTRVFGKFMRLSANPTGGEPSIGLGLAITRELVEMHNGTVGVERPKSGGSCFFIEVDLGHLLE